MVRALCEHLEMDTTEAESLELCLAEVLTNVVKHAYLGVSGNKVSVDVSFTPDRLDLIVRDRGLSMPEEYRSRLQNDSGIFDFDPADLNTVPEGGMGLEIVRRGMDEASYFSGDAGNQYRLTKFLRHPASL